MELDSLIEASKPVSLPPFGPGDTVKVTVRVVEGERERNQGFQGTVIRVKKGGVRSSFTVRRLTGGVGVERTFFFHSPRLEGLEVLRKGRVRRARLYYLRGLTGKAARVKEKRTPRPQPHTAAE
ncbi:MAG: 50S ribosomal protein L19 [Dehalococcoidia bacterium]|nr:50S ribosomal protein L19 [Dehalococcoidia bacterium]MDP6511137.1 50S ribosomal protein L19 [Dehalococcoidia bacterium]MDP6782431.1 50S ribosomal protein L19 [Dehalococcoidia bacterium]